MNRTLAAASNVAMSAREAGIVLGIPIDRKSLAEVTAEALQAIDQSISPRVFACANPHSLVVAQADSKFRSALLHANLIVAEPLVAMPEWHRAHIPDSPLLTDPRVVLENDCGPSGLIRHAGLLHAILVHLDASPTGPRNRTWVDERRWVSAAYEALQQGGLLAIAGSRHVANLTRRLQGSGFEVAEFTVPSSPNAKKPRFLPIWLARKGKATD